MSASTTPTRRPASAMATAILAVTVDLPTPPLPLLMAIIIVLADCSVCVILVSLAQWLGCRGIARAKLWKVNRCQLLRHAGAKGSAAGAIEMAAILTGPKRGDIPSHGQLRGQTGKCCQEALALGVRKTIDDVDKLSQRVIREHSLPLVGQVKRHAAAVPVGSRSHNKPLAFQ